MPVKGSTQAGGAAEPSYHPRSNGGSIHVEIDGAQVGEV